MGCEKDSNIVRVEDAVKIQVHVMEISLWIERNCLNEEHGILESLSIRIILALPCHANSSGLLLWCDEAHVWLDLDGDWGGSIHEEGNWCVRNWVCDCESSIKMSFSMHLESQLIFWLHLDEV